MRGIEAYKVLPQDFNALAGPLAAIFSEVQVFSAHLLGDACFKGYNCGNPDGDLARRMEHWWFPNLKQFLVIF